MMAGTMAGRSRVLLFLLVAPSTPVTACQDAAGPTSITISGQAVDCAYVTQAQCNSATLLTTY